MAYALVGSFGTAATGSGTTSPSFAQATSAGNLLVGWVIASLANATTSATGWLKAVGQSTDTIAIWYKPNCGAGETAPTFSGNGTMWAVLAEFSGGDTSSPTDKIGGGLSATSPLSQSASGADVEAGQLVCACQHDALSKAGTTTSSHTYNNGATASGNANNDATSTTIHYRFSYGITTGNSAADNVSFANNSMNLSGIYGCLASFKLASAAPKSLTPISRYMNIAHTLGR